MGWSIFHTDFKCLKPSHHLVHKLNNRNTWTMKFVPTQLSLREKCSYLEFFWSVFSHIRTEYGEILRVSPYSIRMRENTDQKNSEYGHFWPVSVLKINPFLAFDLILYPLKNQRFSNVFRGINRKHWPEMS